MAAEDIRLRIGAVSYLNTKPLVYGLADAIRPFADLSFAVPSKLASELAQDKLDVGLIPAIEYFRHPNLTILSNSCIACEGPVWSVQVIFRRPPAQVRTLAIDEGSRTSAALTQILLYERFGVVPNVMSFPLSSSIDSFDADALLIIGDRAMHLNTVKDRYVECWDLGQAWHEHTGLPFVFAMWVGNERAKNHSKRSELENAFERQRDAGLLNASQIARENATKYALSEPQVVAYLTKFLHFKIGQRQREALELYRAKADTLGLLSSDKISQQVLKVSN